MNRDCGTTCISSSDTACTKKKVHWNTPEADKSDGFTLEVVVSFLEKVTVTGTPTIEVQNGNEGTGSGRPDLTLEYHSGSATQELTFRLVVGAANAIVNVDDKLSIGSQSIQLNSGTITFTVGGANAPLSISGTQGTAAGTLTVTA